MDKVDREAYMTFAGWVAVLVVILIAVFFLSGVVLPGEEEVPSNTVNVPSLGTAPESEDLYFPKGLQYSTFKSSMQNAWLEIDVDQQAAICEAWVVDERPFLREYTRGDWRDNFPDLSTSDLQRAVRENMEVWCP